MTSFPLSTEERALLTKHRLAIFAGRIIHKARPPITDTQLAKLRDLSCVPVPEELIALWRTTFGGSLDYDLTAAFDGNVQGVSFNQIFYSGGAHDLDLDGWISRDQEGWQLIAKERGEVLDSYLPYFPFGGFGHEERMVVCTKPGPEFGQVELWSQGLPPAWHGRLTEDSMTVMGDSVAEVFSKLHFAKDPFEENDDFRSGGELLEAVGKLERDGPEGEALAERLYQLIRGLIVDWRALLGRGALVGNFAAELTAIEEVLEHDDLEGLRAIAAAGVDLSLRRRGEANALDGAAQRNATACIRWLLAEGVDASDSLVFGAGQSDLENTKALLDGLPADAELPELAVTQSLKDADLATITVLIHAYVTRTPDARASLIETLRIFAAKELAWATKIRSGRAADYREVEDIERRAHEVEDLVLHLREGKNDPSC